MSKNNALVECVPNFSEGRDMGVIRRITDAIVSVADVRVLHVDPGEATNRTVVTFVGPPEAVVEAAFRMVKTAGEVIDMRSHHGTHPRMGATDVLPLVPVSGITLEECAQLARHLAKRIADEAAIPCYCYEASALRPEFSNLAVCRAGEYEALPVKFNTPGKEPDFMPPGFHPEELMEASASHSPLTTHVLRTGCTVVGARNFLIAVNFNLHTTSRETAHAIACDVRERGRNGQPGTLKCVKAIGWYIEEYGIAQVSVNLTDLAVTPLHVAYEEVCRRAHERGVSVTGTEIIGLLPRQSLLDAGRYFAQRTADFSRQRTTADGDRQRATADFSEDELFQTAIRAMGLDELRPFIPSEKVI